METHNRVCHSLALHPAEPLHRRAPARDETGRPYGDFMMVIPGLRSKPAQIIENIVRELNFILVQFSEQVVFADLNLKLNLLWVTVKPGRNVGLAVAAAIHARLPEAKLVAADYRYV